MHQKLHANTDRSFGHFTANPTFNPENPLAPIQHLILSFCTIAEAYHSSNHQQADELHQKSSSLPFIPN